ncbi:MAG: hypothetical protein Q4C04_07600 [Clostridia bacterium]|nr:hypothetical protein [Clostridia bacterium]
MEERTPSQLLRAGTVGGVRPAPQQTRPPTRIGTVNSATYQEFLANIIGYYIICEFLIGVDRLVLRQGELIDVGESYFTLYDPVQLAYTVCDLYSLKFVTYFNEGLRPTSTEFVEWLRAVQEANSLFYSAPSGSQS